MAKPSLSILLGNFVAKVADQLQVSNLHMAMVEAVEVSVS